MKELTGKQIYNKIVNYQKKSNGIDSESLYISYKDYRKFIQYLGTINLESHDSQELCGSYKYTEGGKALKIIAANTFDSIV